MIDRIRRAYAALQKAPNTPLYRFHPELADREHWFSSGAYSAAVSASDSYVAGAEVYRVYAWVRKAIAIKAATVAPLPVRVVDMDGKPVASDLNALFAQPNPTMDGAELWAQVLTQKDLAGEWFAEIVDDARGRPVELWPRRPDHVDIAPDESQPGYPIPAGYVISDIKANTPMLPVEAVIHEKYLNPLSDWRGLAPITAVNSDVALDMFALGYAKGFFKNQARPDYAITTVDALIKDERDRLEAQIDAKYGFNGPRFQKPIVLEAGQGIQPLGWPMKDLALLELREPNRQAVGAIFGVPDEIMGFGKDTYENFDMALKVFWLLTLLPVVQARDSTLTGFFTLTRPILRPGQRIATDLSGVSVLQEALGPKLENAVRLFGMGVPFNQIDQALKLGIGPIPGGDVGYMASTLTPLQLPDAQGAKASSTPILGYHIESGTVSRNEARAQLGLAPEDESQDQKLRRLQSALAVAQAAVNVGIDTDAALRLVGLDAASAPTQRSIKASARAQAERQAQALRRVRTGLSRAMAKDIEQYYADLADRVVARAEAGKAILTARTNGHGGTLTKDLPAAGDLLLPSDDAELSAIFGNYTVEICRGSWPIWNAALGVNVGFDVSDPAVVQAIAQAGDRIKNINSTTLDAVREVLRYGTEHGWSIGQLVRGNDEQPGLRDVITSTYKNRAQAIARTELGYAQASATVTRYQDAGVGRVLILDNGVEDSDPICTALNNTVQTLAWYQQNQLQHPNCLRAAAPIID